MSEDWRNDPRFNVEEKKTKEPNAKVQARMEWDELGWMDQNNYDSFEDFYKTIKRKKISKSSVKTSRKEATKKEETAKDEDWRKALGIDYTDNEQGIDPNTEIKKNIIEKEETAKDEDWRKALGIDYTDNEQGIDPNIQAEIKNQTYQNNNNPLEAFIGFVILFFLGAGVISLVSSVFDSNDTKEPLVIKEYKYVPKKRTVFDSAGDTLDKVNPLNYFKKKKMCQRVADSRDTVSLGKRHYKECMKNPHQYR